VASSESNPTPVNRASKVQAKLRTEEIARLMLDGAEFLVGDLREWVREQESVETSLWHLPPGAKPLSDGQLRRYVRAAEKLIGESCRASRKKLLRRHIARRRNYAAKAVLAGDIRAALACADSEARLLRLSERPAPPLDDGPPLRPEDVVAFLSRQLRALETAALPETERAKLMTATAAALLQAHGATDVEKGLAELETAARMRKGR
jgi:hypothetical protein